MSKKIALIKTVFFVEDIFALEYQLLYSKNYSGKHKKLGKNNLVCAKITLYTAKRILYVQK